MTNQIEVGNEGRLLPQMALLRGEPRHYLPPMWHAHVGPTIRQTVRTQVRHAVTTPLMAWGLDVVRRFKASVVV